MKMMMAALAVVVGGASVNAWACKNGGFEQFASTQGTCGQAISACEGATSVADPKTGMTGYCPGEWHDGSDGTAKTGMGLWADCIGPMSKGKNPRQGGLAVTPALTTAAQQCQAAKPTFCAQNPSAKLCAAH